MSELSYVNYDPEELWRRMITAYIAAGGDVLYPGNEKEILLRGVQAALVQELANIDNGLKMDTLTHGVREYLDIFGEKRFCSRIPAAAAQCAIAITFRQSGQGRTIPAGTALTADGINIYQLNEDVVQTGFADTVETTITSQQAGEAGNGLIQGTQMQLMTPNSAISSIITTGNAAGGREEESDEDYKIRIRTYGLSNTTTGPKARYEAIAKAVSTDVIDAEAMRTADGQVTTYLIVAEGADPDALKKKVVEALSPIDQRPLTDTALAELATPIPYALHVLYGQPEGSNILGALQAAAAAYMARQNSEIGRAFDPNLLTAELYQAGATRVEFAEESHFNNGPVQYTPVSQNAYCHGTIDLAVIA